MDISGNSVDLHPSQLRTFNVDQDIRYYELYEGNLIPLHPGQYVIRAESNGFKFEVKQIKIEKGETINLDFTLSAIYGMLRVVDTGNAQGAKVIVDDKEIGVVPFYGKMMTGHHSLRIDKSGFLPEYESYEFDVEEGKEVVANVSMNRYATYRFTSNPEYSQIFVDGEPMGVTPISVKLKEGVHQLSCQKQGYRANDEEIATDLSSETHDFTFNMEKTYPLLISSDVDSLKVTITKGQGKKRVVYVDDVKTPATVEIPASKTMYHVLLTRGNLSKAYDGYFWFRDGNRKHLKLLSYPIENTCLLGVNYYLKKPKPFLGDTAFEKEFQRLGEVTFAEIQLFPGFTSSVAKGAFFWPTQSQQIVYPANDKGRYGLRPGDDLYRDVSFIPALTLLFLNDEFRIGGALHHNVDLDFLASYAWYPSLVRIMPFNHMSGHDIFVGGEISSRIPIFTASIRVGVQAFYGNVNICRPSGVMPNSATTEDRYISEPYVIPYNQAQGVVSLCMKLGSKNFKGNNILRVF